jgi:hypothetical protein
MLNSSHIPLSTPSLRLSRLDRLAPQAIALRLSLVGLGLLALLF